MTRTSAILNGINVCLETTIILRAADWFVEEDVIRIHCQLGSPSESQRGDMVDIDKKQ